MVLGVAMPKSDKTAISLENEKWLEGFFERVCEALQERPHTRNGPFCISDEELSSALNRSGSRVGNIIPRRNFSKKVA